MRFFRNLKQKSLKKCYYQNLISKCFSILKMFFKIKSISYIRENLYERKKSVFCSSDYIIVPFLGLSLTNLRFFKKD